MNTEFTGLMNGLPGTGKARSELCRAYRAIVDEALTVPACWQAALHWRTSGETHGHKVLDSRDGLERFVAATPGYVRTALMADGLTVYERCQVLDTAQCKLGFPEKRSADRPDNGTRRPRLAQPNI